MVKVRMFSKADTEFSTGLPQGTWSDDAPRSKGSYC